MDIEFSPEQIAADAPGAWVNSVPKMPIAGFAIDSRKVEPGALFFAMATAKDDGHRYLAAALANGACGAVVERYGENVPIPQLLVPNSVTALQSIAAAHRRRYPNPVIAVTGSYGKTTTKELLTLLLGRGETLASAGNENNTLGVPLTLLKLDPKKHRYAVLETGISQPGEMATIGKILQPTHVIFTAISQKHREFFPSREALLGEKLRICESVPRQNGFIVTGAELAQLSQFTPFLEYARVIAREPIPRVDATVYVPVWANGKMLCRIIFPGAENAGENYELPVPSEGFAYDFALCRTLARHFAIDEKTTAQRLAPWKPLPLRGQVFCNRRKKQIYFVDCYNSDVPALIESVRVFEKKFPNLPHYYVIGSMGEYGVESEQQHRLAGEQLSIGAWERILFIGGECLPLCDALKRRGFSGQNMHICHDLDEIRANLRDVEGAIYLKGSRMYGLERLIDFDDCELSNGPESSQMGRCYLRNSRGDICDI
jgi:UDP-N-acetylmuramoyl-tripeptide--D-alanyl-D-alanine ligase